MNCEVQKAEIGSSAVVLNRMAMWYHEENRAMTQHISLEMPVPLFEFKHKLRIPYLKYLDEKCFRFQVLFLILEYLHIYNEIS